MVNLCTDLSGVLWQHSGSNDQTVPLLYSITSIVERLSVYNVCTFFFKNTAVDTDLLNVAFAVFCVNVVVPA